jgi:hypothetical protein
MMGTFEATDATSIVGTWRLISMLSRDPATGEETRMWGDHPCGFLTYTPGGHYSVVLAKSDRAISTDSAGSAPPEEQARLFCGSFANAGRYSPTSDGVIHHVEVATDPTWMGTDQSRLLCLEGNKLVIRSPAVQTVVFPHPMDFSLVFERVE